MKKAELRELYLKKRASLSLGEVSRDSGQIADRFFQATDLSPVTSLHTFIRISKFNEIDTSMIYYRLWRDFPEIVTFAPRTDLTSGTIESVQFDRSTVWNENNWGIREPATGNAVEPAEIDLVIVPLLCFDESGNRVGYGKGMYDRFLAKCKPNCLKVGVSLFPPLHLIDDVAPSDVKLDLCITPTAAYRTN